MKRTPLVYLFLLSVILLAPFNYLLSQQDSTKNNFPKELSKLISISADNVPFEETLQIISSKTGLKFNYNRNRIPLDKILTVIIEKDSVINVLKYILNLTSTELLITAAEQILIVPSKFDQILQGRIIAQVFDSETKRPLVGANVLVEGYNFGSATNNSGEVELNNLPVGTYKVRISYLGYQPVTLNDIIIKSNKITFIEQGLNPLVLSGEEVVIKSNLFMLPSSQTTSTTTFSFEEMRRSATLGGDITRIINSLPSLSNENEANHIVARGGSTIENAFYVDNIQIQNINHFSFAGTSGGLLSILNLDFIKNINVFSGAFSSNYGDRISSIIDINYREGNREEIDLQFDFNFGGISGQIEGPLKNNSGSFMLAAKHSFSDLVIDLIDEVEQPSQFDDIQGKLTLDLSENHKISFINIFSRDSWLTPKDYSIANYWNWYGTFNYHQNVFGVNWKYLWGKNGYSNTSLSHTLQNENTTLKRTITDKELFSLNTNDNIIQLRNVNSYKHSEKHLTEFGIETKLFLRNNINNFAGGVNSYGLSKPPLKIDDKFSEIKLAGFFADEWKLSKKIKITPSIRFDYFSFNQLIDLSPRLSLMYSIKDNIYLTGAAGVYSQNLPFHFLSQHSSYKELENIKSYQFVLGFNWLIFGDTKLTIELYDKEYHHLPIDTNLPTLYLLDEAIYNIFYSDHENIISGGNAFSRGIEFMIQKKLSYNFYGSLSATIFRCRYKDLNGIWRDRVIDNKYLLSVEGGYKINTEWEFSFRWNYAGGMAYTPYNRMLSQVFNSGIFDIDKVNSERLLDYTNFSIRVDKRFHFEKVNLIVYLSIWNLFDRENVSHLGWSEQYDISVNYKKMSRVPILGLEMEF